MSQQVTREHHSALLRTQPWSMFAVAFRLAISIQSLFLALVGLLAVTVAWKISGALFLSGEEQLSFSDSAARHFHSTVSRWPGGRGETDGFARLVSEVANRISSSNGESLADQAGNPSHVHSLGKVVPIDPVWGVPYRMVEPFRQLLNPGSSWSSLGYYAFGGACSLAIWALFGGAITRMGVVQMGLGQRLGLRDVVSFAVRKWTAFFTAPALPLVGISLIAIPLIMFGWLMRLDIGLVVVGLLWGIVLLVGSLMALLAIGLLFGWPLMWGTISTENSDAFDAISRSYAYTFQRPLHYLFYAAVAALWGTLGWMLAWGFSESVISLGYWGTSWGCGNARFAELQSAIEGTDSDDLSSSIWLGARIIELLVGLTRTVASSFSFSYFWSASAAAYLLLRRDTDQTEFDDVVFDHVTDEFEYGLPRLDPDDEGVPGVSPGEESGTETPSDA